MDVGLHVGLERTSIGVVDQAGAGGLAWAAPEPGREHCRGGAGQGAGGRSRRPGDRPASELALAWPAAAEPAGGLPGRPRCQGGARPPAEPDRRQRRLRARATGAQRLVPRGRAQRRAAHRLQCLLEPAPSDRHAARSGPSSARPAQDLRPEAGRGRGQVLARRVRERVTGDPTVEPLAERLLAVWAAAGQQIAERDRRVLARRGAAPLADGS